MMNFALLSSDGLRIHPRQLMRRKAAITLNLPPRLKKISTTWAEKNERSLSTLIEDLLRRHLEENGINPNLTPEEFMAALAEKFGVSVSELKKAAKASGSLPPDSSETSAVL